MITHCNRNDHTLPEDAKRKNLISNKESQRKPLSNSFSTLKFRPILPKNELNTSNSLPPANLMVASVGHNLLPLTDRSNAPIGRPSNGPHLPPAAAGANESVKTACVIAAGSTLSNLNLQPDCLVDSSCQTDLLCQCPA